MPPASCAAWCASSRPAEVTAVVNTGDDTGLHGLYICPDLDTVTYTLAGLNDDERGWGLAGETWRVMDASSGSAARPGSVSATATSPPTSTGPSAWPTVRLCREVTRRSPPPSGIGARLLPMSDDPVRTRLTLVGRSRGRVPGVLRRPSPRRRRRVGPLRGRRALPRPPPACSTPSTSADVVVVCPSNPVVSIGPLLAVPGIADALGDVGPGSWPSPPSSPAPR